MTEKAERYRDFFDLQLRFAEAVAEKRSMPIAEAALLYIPIFIAGSASATLPGMD